MPGNQEPYIDDLDFFVDDGTGFIDDPSAPFWSLHGYDTVPSVVQGDDTMAVVNTIVEGESKAFLLPIADPAGVPLDVDVLRWVLTEVVGDAIPLLEKTSPNGISMIQTGVARLILTTADTTGLSGVYHQEAKIVLQGLTKSVMRGILKVIPSSVI